MTLTDRGIIKEMAVAFLLGLMVFTFVLLTNKILRLVELIVSKGVGIPTVLQLFLYILPYSLVVTIPMSVLLATLATFTRLAGDGEILGLQSAGVSVSRSTKAPRVRSRNRVGSSCTPPIVGACGHPGGGPDGPDRLRPPAPL